MSEKKKQVRERFRREVFSRDGHKCLFCEIIHDLDAHHITNRNEMPNGGYVKENGATLCPKHHELAEEHLQLQTQPEYSPDVLYRLINSSHELAVNASRHLNAKNSSRTR